MSSSKRARPTASSVSVVAVVIVDPPVADHYLLIVRSVYPLERVACQTERMTDAVRIEAAGSEDAGTDAAGTDALRRGRPGYDQRGILEVAVTAFNEHGYDATSIGMLAERLGLSKSAIYHHVASKDELLELALDEALDGLEGVLRAPEATEGAAADRLAFVLRGAVRVLADRLPYVTLLLRVRGNTEVERSALA